MQKDDHVRPPHGSQLLDPVIPTPITERGQVLPNSKKRIVNEKWIVKESSRCGTDAYGGLRLPLTADRVDAR